MKKIFGIIILVLFGFNSMGQNAKSLSSKTESLYKEANDLAQAGDSRKAIDALQRILKNDPQYYLAWFGLADLYHETRERSSARFWYS